jgi:hypothetical protein
MKLTTLELICLLFCSVVLAQDSHQETTTPAAKPSLVLREGTLVYLNFGQRVTPKRATAGDPVELMLAADLKVGDTVVAAAGSRAIGVVLRQDDFYVRATWLQAGKTKVKLHGSLRIPKMRTQKAPTGQTVFHQDVPGTAVVDADTEIPWPVGQLTTVAENEKSAAREAEIPANKIRLTNGKQVQLMLMESISSKKAKPGDSVQLQVLGDVKVDGLVVIANKARAVGVITTAHGAGMAWRAGKLQMQLTFVTLIDRQKQPLQTQTSAKGAPADTSWWADAVQGTGGLAALLIPLAPLQRGNQAIVPKGTLILAETSGEVLLDRSVVEASQTPPAERKQGDATLTVYYPNYDSGTSYKIWCGLVEIGNVRRGHKLNLQLPPGRYVFRLGAECPPVPLQVEEGGEHYLKVAGTQIVNKDRGDNRQWIFQLAVVEHDIGELESADTTPVQAKDATDLSKFSLAQLQAEPPRKEHR